MALSPQGSRFGGKNVKTFRQRSYIEFRLRRGWHVPGNVGHAVAFFKQHLAVACHEYRTHELSLFDIAAHLFIRARDKVLCVVLRVDGCKPENEQKSGQYPRSNLKLHLHCRLKRSNECISQRRQR